MIVSGSIRENYLFRPMYGELQQLNGVYGGVLVLTAQGYTFASYDKVPVCLVKDGVYFEKTAPITSSYDSKQEVLRALKLTVDVLGGKFLDVSQGLYIPSGGIGNDALGVIADHIPQVFGVYPTQSVPDRVCVSVNGEYDIPEKTFRGQMLFSRLGELWKEQ